MELGSPREIQSQIGSEDGNHIHDSDEENHDPLSSSIGGFATQLPLPEPEKPEERTNRHIISTHALLDQLASQKTPKAKPKPARNFIPESASLSDRPEEPSSSFNLSQRPLIAPHSGSPGAIKHAATSVQVNVKHADLKHVSGAEKKDETAFPDSIPAAVLEVLKGWRQECREGRYIPRRLQMIPKDQAKILESDDSWQPALVGRPQHQGTVPITLLNEFCQAADWDRDNILSSNHMGAVHVEAETKRGRHDHNGQPEQQNMEGDKEQQADEIASSEGESEQVEWPSSPPPPPRPRRELPPDSSPLTPLSMRRSETRPGEDESTREDSNDKQPSTTGLEIGHKPPPASNIQDKGPVGFDEQTYDSEVKKNSTVALSSSASMPKANPPPSSLDRVQTSSASVERTVQVKRTPFHVKDSLPLSSIPDSSTHVPATFDEHAYRSRQTAQVDSNVQQVVRESKKPETDCHMSQNFEADSSEDDMVARRTQTLTDGPHVAALTRINRAEDVGSSTRSGSSIDIDKHETSMGSKRKRDLDTSNQSKRHKGNDSELPQPQRQKQSSGYDQIDEERIQYRRQHLSKMSHTRDESRGRDLQHVGMIREAGTGTSEGSYHREISPNETNFSRESQRNRASHITEPTHQRLRRLESMDKLRKSPSSPLAYPNAASVDLFEVFKTAYPTYDGQRNHFIAACQLLRKLHLEGKATHQSLWDDFIHRHFHDYRQYLLEIVENCGSALSYEQFYDEHVEQPTYLHRLVKPSKLVDFLEITQNPRSGSPLVKPIHQVDERSGTPSVIKPTPVNPASADQLITGNLPESHVLQRSSPRMTREANFEGRTAQVSDKATPPRQSQSSSTSVRFWLERAAGAESPVLGTQTLTRQNDVEVPTLDLDGNRSEASISVPTSTKEKKKEKKRRSLPWSSTIDHYSSSGTMTIAKTQKPNARPKDMLRDNGIPLITISKRRKSSRPSSSRQKDQPQQASQETAFQRWNRLYQDLPTEKAAIQQYQAGASRVVDVTAWRS